MDKIMSNETNTIENEEREAEDLWCSDGVVDGEADTPGGRGGTVPDGNGDGVTLKQSLDCDNPIGGSTWSGVRATGVVVGAMDD